jgi:hypothetical protein
MMSSGVLHNVILVRTDLSEESSGRLLLVTANVVSSQRERDH